MNIFGKILGVFVITVALSGSILSASTSQESFSKDLAPITRDSGNQYFDDRLIGTWRIKFRGTQCDGYVEFILDEDGNYSSVTACDDHSYPLKSVGTWTLVKEGQVRLEITDRSPKVAGDTGTNDTQIFNYTFINNNRMRVDRGRIANRVQ